MKKLIVILFAAVLIFATSCIAFAEGAEVAEAAGDTAEGNIFAEVFESVKAHLDEILSGLTLIGSAALAFTYKKGLLPSLSSALSGIGKSVKDVGEMAEKNAVANEGAIGEIKAAVASISEAFGNMAEQITALDARLKESEGERTSAKTMRVIMGSQVDMLYDIFMTSGLPQYTKDAVGERIAAMKAELAKECENGEQQ